MAISNRERVGRALDKLRDGLYPYIKREFKAIYGDNWLTEAINALPPHYTNSSTGEELFQEDVSSLLILMWEKWREVFKNTLGHSERTLVSELRTTRNDWAHTSNFTTDDAYRALDSIVRLLNAISAPEAEQVEKEKHAILRTKYEDQARRETRKIAIAPTEGTPKQGLKPWREIATPHPDVASGNYEQAEFAADLWQVYLQEGSQEYRDPVEFYQRTYLTEGLRHLLKGSLLRLSGQGGDPVIELQTNFGGGKTHTMLALYHLFSGVKASELLGLESLLQEIEINQPPSKVNKAIIVGNKISPGQIHYKPDGTAIKTLWGEIAWQLGGKEGYEMVRAADETATNPGDNLKHLFNRYAPCLILIDEWVAYARQLHDQNDLPAGTFDTHFTFAQTLSESAKNADRTLLVVSIPASDIEIGGDKGKEALDRLKNAIGRLESPWRPATAEESFEIVRRRLFQTTTNTELFVARDAVIKAFCEMYRNQPQEFPSECGESSYERRLKEAYPIHPELFDRLYSDWSSLDKFQRTRGVLRLMSKVIHGLWERGDSSLLIMPAHIPMDDGQVQSELTRYLDDQWIPIIEKDVDGVNSLPLNLDRQHPNLGRYSACRRVTRTIYLGSAPNLRAANRGLEERRIKLGCVQPGENVATFGDAIRRLTDQATYLYLDGTRYWISTQPNVTRTAKERASQLLEEEYPIWQEIIKRLKNDNNKGELKAVHIAPESSADIPDEPYLGVRLVILGPKHPHSKLTPDSPASQFCAEIFNQKGNSPRYYKNTVIFLAPDKQELEILSKNIAQYLAWDSIVQQKEILNLDAFQTSQANAKLQESDRGLKNILNNTFQWLLYPQQLQPNIPLEWSEKRLNGDESPPLKVSKTLIHEENLILKYGARRLSLEVLNPYIWNNNNHISLKKLWDYLTQYLYLPRLQNPEVLLNAVKEGVIAINWDEYFAYAEGFDEDTGKYQGLVRLTVINPSISEYCLIVKPEIAQQQLDKIEEQKQQQKQTEEKHQTYSNNPSPDNLSLQPSVPPTFKRFYGTVEIEALRTIRDTNNIVNEVVQHLIKLNGAKVRISLEIEANLPEGIPEDVIRTVTENCRTLNFRNHGFEVE